MTRLDSYMLCYGHSDSYLVSLTHTDSSPIYDSTDGCVRGRVYKARGFHEGSPLLTSLFIHYFALVVVLLVSSLPRIYTTFIGRLVLSLVCNRTSILLQSLLLTRPSTLSDRHTLTIRAQRTSKPTSTSSSNGAAVSARLSSRVSCT